MFKVIGSLVLASSIIAYVGPSAQAQEININKQLCENEDRLIDHQQQIEACSSLIESKEVIGVDLLRTLYFRATVYRQTGMFENAINDHNRIIDLDPDESLNYYNRAIAYHANEDYRKALRDYSEAIRRNPTFPDSYYNRAYLHQELGDHRNAISDYSRVLEIDPDELPALYNRGRAYFSLLDYGKSIDDFDEVIRRDSTKPHVFTNRGNAYHKTGKHEKAIEDFRQAIDLDPDNQVAKYLLAWTLATAPENTRDGDLALSLAQSAFDAGETWYRRDVLAAAFAATDRFSDAIQQQELAIELARQHASKTELKLAEARLSLYLRYQSLYCPEMPECAAHSKH